MNKTCRGPDTNAILPWSSARALRASFKYRFRIWGVDILTTILGIDANLVGCARVLPIALTEQQKALYFRCCSAPSNLRRMKFKIGEFYQKYPYLFQWLKAFYLK